MTITTTDEPTRRDILFLATGAVAAAGTAAATWPFIAQMNPDASIVAGGAPVELDLAPIAPGQSIKVFWRGAPIFINHRTPEEIAAARNADWQSLRDPEPDEARTKPGHEQWLVLNGICTHLGCIPNDHEGDYHGWLCHCHGSQYDSSGRIRKGPAPSNLALVPYEFITDTRLRIGA